MKHPSLLIGVVTFLLAGGASQAAVPLATRVETFLQPRRQEVACHAQPDVSATILARPDPGTTFLRYPFSLKRQAKKLLSDEIHLLDAR